MSTTKTITGSHEIDPGSMGDGWDDDDVAAESLAEVLREAYDRLGWEVRVSVGHRGSESDDMSTRAAEEIDHIAEAAFEAFCAHEGDYDATLAALVTRGIIPAAD